MKHHIIAGGFGGQGVKILATLLGQAANEAGLHAAMYNLYGAAIRGGAIFCNIVVDQQPITGAPTTTYPTGVLAMDANTLRTFERQIQSGGALVVNTSLIKARPTRTDITTVLVPASEIADELGDFKLSGMVALGALVALTDVVALETVALCLERTLPANRHNLIAGNRLALARGAALAGKTVDLSVPAAAVAA